MDKPNGTNAKPRELTLLAIILGIAISIVFGAANAYLGLRVGMTVTASIPAAVISMAIFRAIGRRRALLENNMVQTIGSAGESIAAGVIFTVPALVLWGGQPQLLQITILALLGGLLGVLMMIPLRRHLIVEEHGTLPYPEGTACAEVLRAGQEGGVRALTVFGGLGIGAAYKWIADGARLFPSTISAALPLGRNAVISMDAFPSLLGVGYIIGIRIAALVFAGGVLGWLVYIPMMTFFGDNLETVLPPADVPISGMGADLMWKKYLRYIGAGAVAFGGLVSLLKSLPMLWRSVRSMWGRVSLKSAGHVARTERDLNPKLIVMGVIVLIAVLAMLPISKAGFVGEEVGVIGAVLIACLVALFGFFFVAVTSRIVGIVGGSSCPVSGMTIATLLASAVLLRWAGFGGDTGKLAALSVGAVVCIAMCLAADASQDLKTGYLVGATPSRQQIGEIIGVLASALFIGLTLLLLLEAYELGGKDLPAPQANLVSMVISGVMEGDLPWELVFLGICTAAVVELFGIASLPFAIGLYLPIALSTPIIVGGILNWLLVGRHRKAGSSGIEATSGVLFSSGLIAGDAFIGIMLAAFSYGDIPLTATPKTEFSATATCIAFAILAVLLARVDWRRAKAG